MDECAGWRPAIEAVAARPRRGAGANEGLKPRLSRCVAFAALPGAVRRPPRCPAARGTSSPWLLGAAPAARRRSGRRAPAARSGAAAARSAAPRRRGRAAPRRAAAPGSAANATHLDRRGLRPSLAPAPRRGCAATASIAGRRPAHSSNVHCDEGACRVYSLAGFTGPFLFSRVTPVQSVQTQGGHVCHLSQTAQGSNV